MSRHYLVVREDKDGSSVEGVSFVCVDASKIEKYLKYNADPKSDYKWTIYKLDGLPQVQSVEIDVKESLFLVDYKPVPTPPTEEAA